MEANSIKTTYLDKDLDKWLNVYKTNGTASTYGHVLVKKIDKSRPRKADGPKGKDWAHPNYAVTCFLAAQSNMAGVYLLRGMKNAVEPNFMAWLQSIKQPVMPEMDLNNFISLLDGSVSFGTQCRDIAMLIRGATGLRPDLEILQNPVASADSIYKVRSNAKDSQAPLVYVNTEGSPIEAQKTIAWLTTVIYNHRGSGFVWIIVPPSSSDALEACILSLFGEEMGESFCSAYLKHLSIWMTPAILQEWGIQYYQVTQSAGQLLFLFPQTYYWGFSAGHNVIEFKTHAGNDWTPAGWNFCSLTNPLCYTANNGQPGLVLGPLDGNNLQGGNQVDNLIVPTPRRTRKRKAVPHENVMEFDHPLPGPDPANPEAPRTTEQAGFVGDQHPGDNYPAGLAHPVGTHNSASPYPVDNSPAHGPAHGRSRNIFENDAYVPGLGEPVPPGSDRGDGYIDNRPEYAEDPYGYSQVGAEKEGGEVNDGTTALIDVDEIDVQFLFRVNDDLAAERDEARRELDDARRDCEALRARNLQLETDLQSSSSERETRLREELNETIQQREFCFAQMVEKDRIIDELREELARR